jgi:hypothetical protein
LNLHESEKLVSKFALSKFAFKVKLYRYYRVWADRPLNPELVAYAAADVHYLHAMRDAWAGNCTNQIQSPHRLARAWFQPLKLYNYKVISQHLGLQMQLVVPLRLGALADCGGHGRHHVGAHREGHGGAQRSEGAAHGTQGLVGGCHARYACGVFERRCISSHVFLSGFRRGRTRN